MNAPLFRLLHTIGVDDEKLEKIADLLSIKGKAKEEFKKRKYMRGGKIHIVLEEKRDKKR